jgi:signal transduction histidine kinase
MSISEVQIALTKTGQDDALVKHFLSIWPLVESILEAFSKATGLPIFAFLGDSKVFQSSMETMPPFCKAMLNSPEMSPRCVEDGLRRAQKVEPEADSKANVQYCHAGMLNGRCEIDTGSVGTLYILFGSKKSVDETALKRRMAIIKIASNFSEQLGKELSDADRADENAGDIESSDIALMNAISSVIEQLIGATVRFRSLTINMAHELSLMMVNMGLLSNEMEEPISQLAWDNIDSAKAELTIQKNHIYHECQLGLHVVRNFLSHTSETRYAEVVRPRFAEIDLVEIISDMVDLHKFLADTKNITFQVFDLADVPKIIGSEMEIRRLFHNILNNAIKYSYHSIAKVRRTIRITAKVPYDPGFLRRRFAIAIENYGLGITKDEVSNVFKAGFRGQQATAEVPVGAGIGLSEARKIMKLHNGEIKIRSRQLHEAGGGDRTYLTTIELVFPYNERG